MNQESHTIQTRRNFIKMLAAGGGAISVSAFAKQQSKGWWDTSGAKELSDAVYPHDEAPGKWQMSSGGYISGEKTNIELRYIHGERPMPPNAYHRLSVEPLSVKSVFHCHPSEGFKIVPFKGALPEVDFKIGSISGLGAILVIRFPKGLKPGETFAVQTGNYDGNGGLTAIVNPVPVEDIPAMVFSNMSGENVAELDIENRAEMWSTQPGEISWFTKGWTDSIPRATILAGPASSLRIFGPTLVQTGSIFDVKIAVTDEFDSRCVPAYKGIIEIEKEPGIRGLPDKLVYTESNNCAKVIRDVKISKPGIYRIKAKLGSRTFESNPIVVNEKVEENIYWGNIHNHNCYSECWGGTMDRFYTFARDISGMDFVSISDHRMVVPNETGETGRLYKWKTGNIATSLESWKDTVRAADQYNKDGEFTALVGYEWGNKTPEGRGYHMNVYHDEMRVDTIEEFFMPGKCTTAELYDLLKKLDYVLLIPHKHGVYFAYEVLQATTGKDGYPVTPGIEVYSDWGDAFSPYGTFDEDSRFGGIRSKVTMSYQQAIDSGYKLAVISDSDSHTGLPGRRIAGGLTLHHDHVQGLTAVRGERLSRRGIIRGYQERKTYGTTGERIFLDVNVQGTGMGQTMTVDSDFRVEVEIAGTARIERVCLFDGMKLLEQKMPNARDCRLSFKCERPSKEERPYFITLVQEDGNRAWSTPIWISSV